MKQLTTIGRILFALPFGIMGLNHFLMQNVFTGMLTSFIPGGLYTVLLTGFVLIVACIFLIIGKYIRTVCLSLAFLLFLFIVTIHIPQIVNPEDYALLTGDNASIIPMIMLIKDAGLMGGALFIAGIYNKEK